MSERITDRRSAVLDAAIELLGTQGMRGLTHRAADAEAGVPIGSTSNYFRTRDALLAAVVERFTERERETWELLAARACPLTPRDLALTIAELARESVGVQRSLTRARYVLLVEGAQRPTLQGQLASTGTRVTAWFTQWLRVVGSPDPERHTRIVANHLVGLVLHELAHPSEGFDPSVELVELLEALVGASAGRPDAVRRRATGREERP
jgi:DNA-binding transcriptional regulator YbjK